MSKYKGPFVRTTHGKFRVELEDDHRELLTHLIVQLRDWLRTTTDDAALRRLFPTAYHNDPTKDAEYQRLMRDDLLGSRLASIDTAIKVVTRGKEADQQTNQVNDYEISVEELDAFSRSINSLRLVLGTNLDVDESSDSGQIKTSDVDETTEDSERIDQMESYEFLGWLLGWTVNAQQSAL